MVALYSRGVCLVLTPCLEVLSYSAGLTWLSFFILGACSHVRSLLYYLHSIREEDLFPSSSCSSVETCNQEMVEDDTVIAYMGERAMQDYQG